MHVGFLEGQVTCLLFKKSKIFANICCAAFETSSFLCGKGSLQHSIKDVLVIDILVESFTAREIPVSILADPNCLPRKMPQKPDQKNWKQFKRARHKHIVQKKCQTTKKSKLSYHQNI